MQYVYLLFLVALNDILELEFLGVQGLGDLHLLLDLRLHLLEKRLELHYPTQEDGREGGRKAISWKTISWSYTSFQ